MASLSLLRSMTCEKFGRQQNLWDWTLYLMWTWLTFIATFTVIIDTFASERDFRESTREILKVATHKVDLQLYVGSMETYYVVCAPVGLHLSAFTSPLYYIQSVGCIVSPCHCVEVWHKQWWRNAACLFGVNESWSAGTFLCTWQYPNWCCGNFFPWIWQNFGIMCTIIYWTLRPIYWTDSCSLSSLVVVSWWLCNEWINKILVGPISVSGTDLDP